MGTSLRKFLKCGSGVTAIEYALTVAGVALVTSVTVDATGRSFEDLFEQAAGEFGVFVMEAAEGSSDSGGGTDNGGESGGGGGGSDDHGFTPRS